MELDLNADLTILTIFLVSCSEPHKKGLFDIKIGNKTINLNMDKTELCKLYESHENDAGIVYFFLDNEDKDNNFNATFYSNGKIKTFYTMSQTSPVIRFFKDIHIGMSKDEFYNSLAMKSKKDMNRYMNIKKIRGTYIEIFIDHGVVGAAIWSYRRCADGHNRYILYMTEEELLMGKISSRGGYDGFVLQRPKYFFRAETDGSRERRIGTLYLHKKKSHGRI